MRLEDLIHRRVETIPPNARCSEAAQQMRDAAVGSLVVIEDEQPIGILTDRDLVVRVMASGEPPERVRVRDVMSTGPIFLSRERSVEEILETMGDLAIRRIPVVDDQQRLVGILSLDDLILHLAGELGRVAETLRKKS